MDRNLFADWPVIVTESGVAGEFRMMNSLAVVRAAYIGCKRMRGMLAAAILAEMLSGCLFLSESAPTPEIASAAAEARGPCPSRDFAIFLDAFGESVDVQREYTRIPLVYGQLNAGLIGTPKENAALATRSISSFDAIPVSDSKDGGRILRSKIKRRERGLKVKVEPGSDDDKGTKIVTILLPGTGFHLKYHFATADACWELVRIDDLSKT